MSERVEKNLQLTNIISCGVLLLSIALFLYLAFYRNNILTAKLICLSMQFLVMLRVKNNLSKPIPVS